MRRAIVVIVGSIVALVVVPTAGARVLRVGTYHGIKGQYKTIQGAINAAKSGDWILVGPGDYKTTSSKTPPTADDTPAAVLITKPNLRLRGMNRNTVVIDGTKPHSPRCSASESAQNLGPASKDGPMGLNGVVVWKANNVWVQNLTACNFLNGSGHAGNEIWWNGGDGGGKIGGHGYYGSYLTATSTFYKDETTAAGYGIFSSNWSGGTWDTTYASNFNDSNYYIGACQQQCDQVMNHAWSEYSSLGYSGTNAGGSLVIENSEFDNNKDGFDTNSQNNDDWPSPQDGSCPNGAISPITHTTSCWVFMNNYVHDNNNPYVPGQGVAAAGPVGTGISISGGRNDTVMNNRFVNNGAWGAIFVPYPDTETPPPDATACSGGTSGPSNFCNYDDWGNSLIGNTFTNNGSFGNPSNGDFAELTATAAPSNCFSSNTDTSGTVTSSPPGLEQLKPCSAGHPTVPPDANAVFLAEVACDSQFFASLTSVFGTNAGCLPTDKYPRGNGTVIMHPLPKNLATMPNPCAGVPANPWCTKATRKPATKKKKPTPKPKTGATSPSFTG
jgi:hypothetical protein